MNKIALVEFGMYTRKVGLFKEKLSTYFYCHTYINYTKFAYVMKIEIKINIPQSSMILFPPIQTSKQDRPTSCPAPRGVTVIDDIFNREIYFFQKLLNSSNF